MVTNFLEAAERQRTKRDSNPKVRGKENSMRRAMSTKDRSEQKARGEESRSP
jgi:hypothetical protein